METPTITSGAEAAAPELQPPSQPTVMEQWLGVNWRTKLAGLAETLGVLAVGLAVIPPEHWQHPRLWIPAVLAAIAKTMKDLNTKDKQVSGGSVLAKSSREVRVVEPKPVKLPPEVKTTLSALALGGTLVFLLSGCAVPR